MRRHPTFTFAVVLYHAYYPVRENCRVTATFPNGKKFSFERENWEHLFKDLRSFYPGAKIEVPDEIEVIELDKGFRRIS